MKSKFNVSSIITPGAGKIQISHYLEFVFLPLLFEDGNAHFQEFDLPFKEQNYCEELHCL